MLVKNKINNCFIHLVDFKSSKEWYKRVFGFKVKSEEDDFLEFDLEGTTLILLPAQVKELNPLPYSVFFFETNDIDQTYQQLVDMEVDVDDIRDFPEGMKGCHFYDPEGNILLACTTPN
ncbi:VOC family protein [Alkalibacillus haloalkaliphilus]|uniref:VOC domain-containing protein n=1 Tax=Alkalibacillus haloalkaliphilus TaxID=94136 RepID=A0A511W5I5_9BACI|nr:VOC family protein [Alkalibacillus haloalkaliphilus]GEN46364.1 hypothetical protein AHA02nite_21400 [Alkalibacillus haloalkaliphilus]